MAHQLIQADARRVPLKSGSVHCVVTSPPYFCLRDYGTSGQIGIESSPSAYVAAMVEVFRELRRVLRDDGTAWMVIGDSFSSSPPGNTTIGVSAKSGLNGVNGASGVYRETLAAGHATKRDTTKMAGLKPKDLIGIPWLTALSIRDDGWYLRSASPWVKRSALPESVTDRPASALEYVFQFAKSSTYFYDPVAVRTKASTGNAQRTTNGYDTSDRYGADNGGNGGLDALAAKMRNGESAGRHRRNSDLWFESVGMFLNEDDEPLGFDVTTQSYKGAHFATFPPRLVEPMIRSSTSEAGCCPACGSPYARVTERTRLKRDRPNDYTKRTGAAGTGNSCANSVAGVSVSTLGWEPTCACPPAPPVPCVIFDPFSGSGTTLLAAERLGRHGVGTDLSADYLNLAAGRIRDGLRPVSRLDARKAAAPSPGQQSLFDLETA